MKNHPIYTAILAVAITVTLTIALFSQAAFLWS